MPSFLIGSSAFLQVTRTSISLQSVVKFRQNSNSSKLLIKAWMSLNFGGISPLTAELAALERLKKTYNLVSTLGPSFLFGSSSFLQVTKETI